MKDLEADQKKEPWHLDKRVPLALIVTIIAQTLLLVISGTALAVRFDARLTTVETYQTENKSAPTDLAVVKSEITNIKDILRQIQTQLTLAGQRQKP